MFWALIYVAILDFLAFQLVGITQHALSSRKNLNVIILKFSMFIVISIAHIIDSYLFQIEPTLKVTTLSFYLINEVVSILGRFVKMGLPLPNLLIKIFQQEL